MTNETIIKLRGEVGGPDFNCRMVTDALDGAGAVHVVIHSGGGCSITSFAIYHELIEHDSQVTTEIIRAGSAAVLPALAGGIRKIHGSGSFFLHRSWGVTVGTVNALRKAIQVQNTWDAVLAGLYAERTGQPKERILRLMDSETRMGAAEAVQLRFAHKITGQLQPIETGTNLDEIAVACLEIEGEMRGRVMTEYRHQAKPAARRDP